MVPRHAPGASGCRPGEEAGQEGAEEGAEGGEMILFSSPTEKLRLGLLVAIEQRRPTTEARKARVFTAILAVARRHGTKEAINKLMWLAWWRRRGSVLRDTRRTQRLILAMIKDGSMFRSAGPLWVPSSDGREVRSFPGLISIKSARFVRGRVV